MSTTRNTKGQFARKTAPKKPVKKPSLADIQHFHGLTAEYLIDWRKELSTQLDQIQRDIEQVRTLAHQTRTNSRANTVILNKTLAGVDLLKSVTVNEGRDTNVVTPPAQPEEPKAEPWVPKVGDWVVCDKVQKGPSPGWAKPFMDDLIGIPMKVVERERAYAVRACSFLWADEWLRPATQEEIAEAEGEWKLKKLVRGCRVETPDGKGIYMGEDKHSSLPHCVRLDGIPTYLPGRYTLDQLTPLI